MKRTAQHPVPVIWPRHVVPNTVVPKDTTRILMVLVLDLLSDAVSVVRKLLSAELTIGKCMQLFVRSSFHLEQCSSQTIPIAKLYPGYNLATKIVC